MKAKFVYEKLEDILKPKSEEEILSSMDDLSPKELLDSSAESGFLPGVTKAVEDIITPDEKEAEEVEKIAPEVKVAKGKESEISEGDNDEGNKSEAVEKIDELNTAAERVEKANARAEEIMSKEKVAGEAEAGQETEKPKEETDEEYTDKVLKGEESPLE